MSFLMQENYYLFQAVNNHAGNIAWLDTIMIFLAEYLVYCWPLILLLLWGRPLAWRGRPLRPGEGPLLQECRGAVIWAIVACIVAYVVNRTIGHFIFEPRPFVSHHVHQLVPHAADASFPSDHTAWSFAVFGVILFALPRQWYANRRQWLASNPQELPASPLILWGLIAVGFVMAFFIGFSRIFVGVHYPGDILGGAICGLIVAGVITLIRRRWEKPTQGVLSLAQRCRLA